MKITDIKKGMTLYHRKVNNYSTEKIGNSTNRRHVVEVHKYFILEEPDLETETVIASRNGAPAALFSKSIVNRWKKEKPTD